MSRVTNADLDKVCENLNRRLANRGALTRVGWERRYGYVGLDEISADGVPVRAITNGPAREVYEAAWHMIRALDLLP